MAELTDFACALRDADVSDLGGGMCLLSFGGESYFPTDDDLCRNSMVVRDFYDELFQRTAAMRRSLLTGVPGTGKSWWIWYAVHKVLKQDPAPAIVWQTFKRGIDQCVLFKDGKAFVGHLNTFIDELGKESTW